MRLDAETKVSPDLESAFFSVKGGEKEGALLHLLQDVIKMPLGLPPGVDADEQEEKPSNKRKRGSDRPNPKEKPTEYSTIVFTATKHHVEYIQTLLAQAGFAVSYIYGSLDQTARNIQVDDFRRGRSHILVVTDLAARGIDIPILANVINYDFPPQPKVFVHRVGRTARAGQRGWAYSLVRDSDVPYLLDLQLFMGRKLVIGQEGTGASFAQDVVLGGLQRSDLEPHVEWVNKLLHDSDDVSALQRVAGKAEKLYMRTRNSASVQSAKRARDIVASRAWTQLHGLFGEDAAKSEHARSHMLAKISAFKPEETIFEIGPKGRSDKNKAAVVMRTFRSRVGPRRSKYGDGKDPDTADLDNEDAHMDQQDSFEAFGSEIADGDDKAGNGNDAEQSDSEPEVVVSNSALPSQDPTSFRDPEIFMSYTPRTTNAAEEKAYGVSSGSYNPGFVESARDAAMDLANDEGAKAFGVPARSRLRWDKQQSKYVARENDTDGSRGGPAARMIRGESGVKIAASFQSGRFDRWRKAQRIGKMPRVGEAEKGTLVRHFSAGGGGPGGAGPAGGGGRKFKHRAEKAPKDADKYRDDYHVRKKRVADAKEKRIGKYRNGEGSRSELKSATDIRKARQEKEKKLAKNGRPTKKARR